MPDPPAPPPSPAAPPPPPAVGASERDPAVKASLARYWRANITIMAVLLGIWALAGLGCGVLFADWLNQFRIGGYPLGFWFAQQGSIIVFVAVILAYCILLNRLDKKHHEELEALRGRGGTGEAGGRSGGRSGGDAGGDR